VGKAKRAHQLAQSLIDGGHGAQCAFAHPTLAARWCYGLLRALPGDRAIVLTNQKGAVLELSGHQMALMANADLSGLAITLK